MKRSIPQLRSLNSVCLSCRHKLSQARPPNQSLPSALRLLSSTPHPPAEPPPTSSAISSLSSLSRNAAFQSRTDTDTSDILTGASRSKTQARLVYRPPPKPHHLHIYATKHNCHITLTTGTRDPILSVSSGNIGFRKAARGTYDAAYQLGAFVMGKISQMGLMNDGCNPKQGPIRQLEIVLRDFGPGREAVTKILMGAEAKVLRSRVTRVMDGTRLKFGGSRSPKPRRLG